MCARAVTLCFENRNAYAEVLFMVNVETSGKHAADCFADVFVRLAFSVVGMIGQNDSLTCPPSSLIKGVSARSPYLSLGDGGSQHEPIQA